MKIPSDHWIDSLGDERNPESKVFKATEYLLPINNELELIQWLWYVVATDYETARKRFEDQVGSFEYRIVDSRHYLPLRVVVDQFPVDMEN